jgi:hypothetical protein
MALDLVSLDIVKVFQRRTSAENGAISPTTIHARNPMMILLESA